MLDGDRQRGGTDLHQKKREVLRFALIEGYQYGEVVGSVLRRGASYVIGLGTYLVFTGWP